jgi:hypothetical protein
LTCISEILDDYTQNDALGETAALVEDAAKPDILEALPRRFLA